MTRTLLLNASDEPLCLVTQRRAVVLVLTDKAMIVERADGAVRAERVSVPVPSVIRLTRYVRVPYRATPPLTKRNLLARDRGHCGYCALPAQTVDHVIPRSRGGLHRWDNVVAACGPCNNRKSDRLLAELGWRLRVTPTTPRGTRYLLVAVSQVDPAWARYLQPAA